MPITPHTVYRLEAIDMLATDAGCLTRFDLAANPGGFERVFLDDFLEHKARQHSSLSRTVNKFREWCLFLVECAGALIRHVPWTSTNRPLMRGSQESAVVIGTYGGEHVGDSAILGGVLMRLYDSGTRRVAFMSHRPDHTRWITKGISTPIDIKAGADPFKTLTQNEFTTAESLDAGMTQAGVHFTLGESYRSFYPTFRFGLGALAEAGIKFGVTTADTGTEDKVVGMIGGDIKYQLVKQTEGVPVDMAIDLGFDTHIISGKNVSEVTFSTIFSRAIPLTERGYKITPYGGLELSALYGSYFPTNENDFYVFAGVEWKLTQKSMFYAELKAGNSFRSLDHFVTVVATLRHCGEAARHGAIERVDG